MTCRQRNRGHIAQAIAGEKNGTGRLELRDGQGRDPHDGSCHRDGQRERWGVNLHADTPTQESNR